MRHPQVPIDGRKTTDLQSPSAHSPEHLFRLLIGQLSPPTLAHLHSTGLPAEMADEIVLDMELDGFRYFLVRALKSSRAPVELSPREKEIVRMVAQGHPNKVIADVLNISSWTVCTHLRRVFAKLGVGSRAAMVARLLEIGAIRSGAPLQNLGTPHGNLVAERDTSGSSEASQLPSRREKSTTSRRQTA